MIAQPKSGDRSLFTASILSAVGIILSGPLGLLAVTLVHGQPAWTDADTFIRHYHPIQTIPFVFGFVLVSGLVLFLARCAALFPDERKDRAYTVLVATAAFAALIVTNYTLQIAYVPWLVRRHESAVAYFTMTNPGSLCWGFEMFGYGVVGVAMWMVIPLFDGAGRRRWIRALLVANGVVSILGAVITAIDLSWVQTPAGLACFIGWNMLLLAAMMLVAIDARDARASAH